MERKILANVKTGTKQQKIERVDDIHVQAWLKSQPHDGKANEELITLIARHFKVPPSCVTLAKGHHSKKKTLILADR